MSSPPSEAPAEITTGWPERIWLALILVLAAGVRLGNLHVLPVFIDESAHLAFGTDPDYTLPMLAQFGKVLGFVIFYPTSRFGRDPLFDTRVLVAMLGVLTVLGIYLAVRHIAGKLAAAVAAAIWALLPYVTFHDRMALHDPLISCFTIWALVFYLRFLKNTHLRRMLLLAGFFTGLTIATKITALHAIGWFFLLAVAYLGVAGLRKNLHLAWVFAGGVLVPLLVFVPGATQFLGSSRQFLEPEAGYISRAQLILAHFHQIITWITVYDSAAFTLFCGIVLFLAIRYRSPVKLALLLSFLTSCAVFATVFVIWFSRYLLPVLLPLVMLAGMVTADCLSRAAVAWRTRKESTNFAAIGTAAIVLGLLALCAGSWADANWRFQKDPHLANIPAEDRFQYLDGWPSGTGVRELAAFLNQTTRESSQQILILYAGYMGRHMRWSLPLYIKKDPRAVYRYQPISSRLDLWRVLLEAARQPTYLVLEPPMVELPPELVARIHPPLNRVFEFKRPAAPGGFVVYRLDQSMYLDMPAPTSPPSGDQPKIVDILSPNGVEKLDGQPFTWIGEDGVLIRLDSPRTGMVELAAELQPGPSVAGTTERHLLIKTFTGFSREMVSAPGKVVFAVPVAMGQNELLFEALDKPNVPSPLPNGDTRKLIIGLRGLQITRFDEGTVAQTTESRPVKACSASFGAGWYGREKYGTGWLRWNSGRSEITIYSQTRFRGILRGELSSLPRPNTISLYFRGGKLTDWEMKGEGYQRIPDVVLSLEPGENTLEFVSAKPAANVPNDNRKLAVVVRNLEIAGEGPQDACKLNQ